MATRREARLARYATLRDRVRRASESRGDRDRAPRHRTTSRGTSLWVRTFIYARTVAFGRRPPRRRRRERDVGALGGARRRDVGRRAGLARAQGRRGAPDGGGRRRGLSRGFDYARVSGAGVRQRAAAQPVVPAVDVHEGDRLHARRRRRPRGGLCRLVRGARLPRHRNPPPLPGRARDRLVEARGDGEPVPDDRLEVQRADVRAALARRQARRDRALDGDGRRALRARARGARPPRVAPQRGHAVRAQARRLGGGARAARAGRHARDLRAVLVRAAPARLASSVPPEYPR